MPKVLQFNSNKKVIHLRLNKKVIHQYLVLNLYYQGINGKIR
jgi:hypothetical protein